MINTNLSDAKITWIYRPITFSYSNLLNPFSKNIHLDLIAVVPQVAKVFYE